MNARVAGVSVDKLIMLLHMLGLKSPGGRHLRGQEVYDYVNRVQALIGPKYWQWDENL